MSFEETLESIKEEIRNSLPSNIDMTSVEFEGPEIAIYCRNEDFVGSENEEIKVLVKRLRKRIVIRSDPSIRKDNDETVEVIRKIVPAEAEITKILFNENLGECLIEARKPGIAIGKAGQNLKDIKKATNWLPRVIRTPPIESRTVELIRSMLQKERQMQKEIFLRIGQRIHRPGIFDDLKIRMTTLGSFREVGRSAIFIQTNESSVLLDCGMNIGNQDDIFPYLNYKEFDVKNLDAVILTHSHLDHARYDPILI